MLVKVLFTFDAILMLFSKTMSASLVIWEIVKKVFIENMLR